jgi:hypothetical protein
MSLVGTNIERVGIRAKVSGGISYIADLQFTGQIYAKALRSPYAHAKLLRIDATKAAACAGVHAVVTREDLADLNPCFGIGVEDQPVVVIDKTRYAGDIVAVVAAETREIAEEAAAVIEIQYEPLAAATDLIEAANQGAPIIHEQHIDKTAGGNIHGVYHASSGDIELGFTESDEVIENLYTLPSIQHGHIEPHGDRLLGAKWEARRAYALSNALAAPGAVGEDFQTVAQACARHCPARWRRIWRQKPRAHRTRGGVACAQGAPARQLGAHPRRSFSHRPPLWRRGENQNRL